MGPGLHDLEGCVFSGVACRLGASSVAAPRLGIVLVLHCFGIGHWGALLRPSSLPESRALAPPHLSLQSNGHAVRAERAPPVNLLILLVQHTDP